MNKKIDKRKKYTDEQVQQMCLLMQSGHTAREIAGKMGITYNSTFAGYISALKTGYNRKSISNPFKIENVMRTPSNKLGSYEYNYICNLLEKNYSITEIAEKLGVECTESFQTSVNNIVTGKSWVNVSKNYNFKNRAKLVKSLEQVERIHAICKLLEEGLNAKQIAKRMNIECNATLNTTISEIRSGKIWKSISKNYDIDRTPKLTKLTDDDIHKICVGIQQGLEYKEIAESIDVECSKNFTSIVRNIKNRKHHTAISNQYNFIKVRAKYNMTKRRTNKEIHEICRLISEGYNSRQIAAIVGEESGKDFTMFIYRIKKGIIWTKISKDYNIVEK